MPELAPPVALATLTKAFESLVGYAYDAAANRYRNAKTGQFVPFREIYSLIDRNEQASAQVLNNLAVALSEGALTPAEWYTASLHQIRLLHVQQAAIGAGGFGQLKPSDFMRIDRLLREDMPRLRRFGTQIVNGEQSLGQIQNRCNMYAGHARIQFFRAQPMPYVREGETVIERRRLQIADHCSWCTYLADLSWQAYGVLPVPGESGPNWEDDQCLTNCQCEMDRLVLPVAEAELLLSGVAYDPNRRSIKGGPGSGNFGHAGRRGEIGGSAPSGAGDDGPPPSRAWTGQQDEATGGLSKLDTGAAGEKIAIAALSQILGLPFETVNVGINNAAFDVAGDSRAVEVKTGLATNSKSAQQWRATIGQPGKEETALLKQMTTEQKREHNTWKSQQILERKRKLLAKLSSEAGRELKPLTVGVILSGDGKRGDVFLVDGFHLRLGWSTYATDQYYAGTYDLTTGKMHLKRKR